MGAESKIELRPKRLSDAKEDYAWQTDAELVQLDAALLLDIPYQQYLSEFTFELCYPSQNRHEFAVETSDGKHIANCVYYNINAKDRKAEVGIMIGDRDYWNKGIGVEIMRALLRLVFNTTDLQHIYLTTLDWNIRAQKCFHKCGFADCGYLNRDGSTFIVMAIHRPQWAERNEAAAPPTKVATER
jgi:RimJ/RimL family protein N-acetyltransferase